MAALSLHRIGVARRVCAPVPPLAPLGYGINLQPNAVRKLTAPAALSRRSRPIHALTLVTRNESDFESAVNEIVNPWAG